MAVDTNLFYAHAMQEKNGCPLV